MFVTLTCTLAAAGIAHHVDADKIAIVLEAVDGSFADSTLKIPQCDAHTVIWPFLATATLSLFYVGLLRVIHKVGRKRVGCMLFKQPWSTH